MCVDLAESIWIGATVRSSERDALDELTKRRDLQATAARQVAARLHEATALAQVVEEAAASAKLAISRVRAAAGAAASAGSANGAGGSEAGYVLAESSLAPLAEAADRWLHVRRQHPEGFAAWKLADVAASMVCEALRLVFRGWRPLLAPVYGTKLIRSWQAALGSGASGGDGAYEALVYLSVMPALRGLWPTNGAFARAMRRSHCWLLGERHFRVHCGRRCSRHRCFRVWPQNLLRGNLRLIHRATRHCRTTGCIRGYRCCRLLVSPSSTHS